LHAPDFSNPQPPAVRARINPPSIVLTPAAFHAALRPRSSAAPQPAQFVFTARLAPTIDMMFVRA
jgi:hypothetical protein